MYDNPDPLIYPTIFATKQAILYENEKQSLFAYFDLHGHATKRGCFVFGNSNPDQVKHVEQMLLPKIMSLNSVNFDFLECSFNDSENNVKD